MQTKTYFANNVPAALEVARRELGADALLVNSRPAPAEMRQLGRVEVTFAFDPPETQRPEVRDGAGTGELDDIREQLSLLRAAVGHAGEPARGDVAAKKDSFVVERLCEAGLTRATAVEVAAAVSAGTGDLQGAVIRELGSRISIAPVAQLKSGESRTMAFVGPPGRGKTTSLVKIAVTLGLARRVPVRIYSVGSHCIGGQEQIARYAAILGAPFQAYESVENLNLALNGEAWRGLALIDTPGLAPSDTGEIRDLGKFFSGRREIETHLVLRADARSADMLHVISRFSCLQASRLMFTGLDEAASVGPMVDLLVRGGIPGTFGATGQQIPDDLEELNPEKLARAVWIAGAKSQVEPDGMRMAARRAAA